MHKNADYEAVILGAGPYGLSVAAHLLQKGVKTGVFGKPMSFWQNHMPKVMLIRSRWWANSISDPDKKYTIESYLKSKGITPYDPLPEEVICDYGLWFHKNLIKNIDQTYITNIKKNNKLFIIQLEDGREVTSASVILAPGLAYYKYIPEEFTRVDKKFISHTCDNIPFNSFKGKRVVVIGGGQSALENAALMSEAGIDVHLVHRSPLRWTSDTKKTFYQKIRYPKAGISDGWDNWILEHFPYIFQRLPRKLKDYYLTGKGSNGPMGTYWLIPRLKQVNFHHEKKVKRIAHGHTRIKLIFSDDSSLLADHIVLATGYKVNVNRLSMLDHDLIKQIKKYKNSPVLNNYFESSVEGLYFCGITAHLSFGPLFRFIVGADAAARKISNGIVRKKTISLRLPFYAFRFLNISKLPSS